VLEKDCIWVRWWCKSSQIHLFLELKTDAIQYRYICEISPTRHRGALATGPQLLITVGLVVGFFTCYGTTNVDSSFSWRLPFMLLAVYSFLFSGVTLFYLPPSPRWLTVNGKVEEVSAAWEKLGVPAADQEKIFEQLDDSAALVQTASTGVALENLHRNTTNVSRRSQKKAQILDVLSSESRPRLFLALFLMGMQQLSGIDGVLYVCEPHHACTYADLFSSTLQYSFSKPVLLPTKLNFWHRVFRHWSSSLSVFRQRCGPTNGVDARTQSSVA
jgi:hypothetical protein